MKLVKEGKASYRVSFFRGIDDQFTDMVWKRGYRLELKPEVFAFFSKAYSFYAISFTDQVDACVRFNNPRDLADFERAMVVFKLTGLQGLTTV